MRGARRQFGEEGVTPQFGEGEWSQTYSPTKRVIPSCACVGLSLEGGGGKMAVFSGVNIVFLPNFQKL